MVGDVRQTVPPGAQTVIVAPDQRGRLVVPAGVVPASLQGQRVEIEFKNLKEDTIPPLPSGEVALASYEVNTLVDGVRTLLTYDPPVEFSFPLSREDWEAAGHDPARLRLLRFLDEERRWSEVASRYEPEPPPAGRLVAELNRFSLFAIGLFPVAPPPTATPTPTAVPPVPTGAGFPAVYVILGVAALVALVLLVWWRRGRRRTT